MTDIFLRLPEVKRITGYSRSSIYSLVNRGEFPAPVPLGLRAIAWPESEINDWMEKRKSARRKESHTAVN